MRYPSRLLVIGSTVALAASCRPSGSRERRPQAASAKPNVVWIVLDACRPHFGCYGYDRPTSPNTDRLAARGTLFENCISQST